MDCSGAPDFGALLAFRLLETMFKFRALSRKLVTAQATAFAAPSGESPM